MEHKKIVFLGSKPVGYRCLAWLISQQEALGASVVAVLTNKRTEFGTDSDLAQLAAQNNIPVATSLENLPDCDVIYSVQYHEILKQEHIDKARQVAVNLHMAPLPEYRGSNQFSFAIVDGKTEFGTTIHLMDTRIDHGDVLFQKRFKIPAGCWINELYDLTVEASVNLFKQTLGHVLTGRYNAVPQQLLESRYGTSLHYRHEMAALKQIDLNWDAEQIDRHVRATSMPGFEPPYCIIGGKKVFFTKEQK